MPIACTFMLNGKQTSTLACPGVGDFPAFSGQQGGRNNPAAAAQENIGPLPPGRYYIVDRQSGGRLGWLYDWFKRHSLSTDHSAWFALYRDDGTIDDETSFEGIRRGNFRLHPIGPLRLSEGCITLVQPADFDRLHDALKGGQTISIPGGITAYGTVDVR